VAVCINYTKTEKQISLQTPGFAKIKKIDQYLTTAGTGVDMKHASLSSTGNIKLPARSIATFVLE